MGCGPREMSHGFEQSNAAIEDGMPCSCLFQREYYTIYAQSPQEKNGLQATPYEPFGGIRGENYRIVHFME